MIQLKSGNEQSVYVSPSIRKPTTEETLHVDPLIAWVATVALVLILILVVLSSAAWREQKKRTKAVLALASTSIPESPSNPGSALCCNFRRGGRPAGPRRAAANGPDVDVLSVAKAIAFGNGSSSQRAGTLLKPTGLT